MATDNHRSRNTQALALAVGRIAPAATTAKPDRGPQTT
jgi:hypothetical protein